MPEIRGCSLRELLEVYDLRVEEAQALFVGIVDGVAAAHAAGAVHRDIKPGNVLLDPQSGRIVPRVTDFGVARDHGSDATDTGVFLGTPAYAAPEQQRDASSVDERADLWSLGVVFHEMLVGRRPDGGIAPEVPSALQDVLAWLLEPVRTKRCPSAAALRERLGKPAPELLGLGTPLGVAVRRRFAMTADPTDALPRLHSDSLPALPSERDAFVGRQTDLRRLAEALDLGRVVVITGFGGVGKTRLLIHFLRQDPSRKVFWCDLSDSRDEEGVLAAVAKGLGVGLSRELDATRIGLALGERGRCLVALDNAEQVAAPLRSLLEGWASSVAAEATFLVASRIPLGVSGERRLSLDPLDAEDGMTLFVERIRATDGRFDPANVDPRRLVDLIDALDGVPLAIELAAARAQSLGVDTILERLTDRFRLLRTTTGARAPRQATLRATLDWSWALLTPEDRRALAQLSVFEDGFSLEAAEAVLDVPSWALDVVERLVEHSLVQVGERGRFRLLVTVQAYAAEALEALGAREAAEIRHTAHFARVAEQATPAATLNQLEALETLDREVENLAAACERALDRGDADHALSALHGAWFALERQGSASRGSTLAKRLIARREAIPERVPIALDIYASSLRHAGRLEDARAALEDALGITQARGDSLGEGTIRVSLGTVLRDLEHYDLAASCLRAARGLAPPGSWLLPRIELGLGLIEHRLGNLAEGRSHLLACLDQLEAVDDPITEAAARNAYGAHCVFLGDYVEGRYHLQRSLERFQAHGAWHEVQAVHRHLSHVAIYEGHLDEADRHLHEALDRTRAFGLLRDQGMVLSSLGVLRDEQGDLDGACTALEEALRIHRRVGNGRFEGIVLINLGRIRGTLGHVRLGIRTFEEALSALRRADDRANEAECRVHFADLLLVAGRSSDARRELDLALPVLHEIGHALFEAVAQARLGDVAASEGDRATATTLWRAAVQGLRAVGAPMEHAKVLAQQARREAAWDCALAAQTLAEAEAVAEPLSPAAHGELDRLLEAARLAVAGAVKEPR